MHTYDFWEAQLKEENYTSDLPGDEFYYSPQPGFYKKRTGRDGPWEPIAFWEQDGNIVASNPRGAIDAVENWSWCMANAITEEEYRFYEKNGRWSGECEVGHNNPPDGFEEMKSQTQEIIAKAEQWLDERIISTQSDADKATGFQQALSKLSKQADNERKEKKKPHFEAGKKIDADYKPLIEEPKSTISKLKSCLTVFLRAEKKKNDERERLEQIEAAKKIAEAEKIKNDAEKKNLTAKEEKIVKEGEAAVAFPVRKKKVSAGGNTGRKLTLRKVKRGEIVDYDKLLNALKDRDEIKDLVQSLANRAAKAGVELDGMKIVEEQVV